MFCSKQTTLKSTETNARCENKKTTHTLENTKIDNTRIGVLSFLFVIKRHVFDLQSSLFMYTDKYQVLEDQTMVPKNFFSILFSFHKSCSQYIRFYGNVLKPEENPPTSNLNTKNILALLLAKAYKFNFYFEFKKTIRSDILSWTNNWG
jgi:hypothetical protein